MEWVLLVLLLLVIGALVWMLLRRPSGEPAETGTREGGPHVVDADAAAAPGGAPATGAPATGAPATGAPVAAEPYDQAADEPTYTDTASGTEVPADLTTSEAVTHHESGYDQDTDARRGDDEDPGYGTTQEDYASDQGHPGPSSQGTVEATSIEDDEDDYVVDPAQRGGAGATRLDYADTTDDTTDDTTGTFTQAPYGPGSAQPAADGSGPAGWEVKGNVGSMLFHTPDSPSYDGARAEVWFESEEAARAAGFAHWDRKRR